MFITTETKGVKSVT